MIRACLCPDLQFSLAEVDGDSELDIATVMSKPSHKIQGPAIGMVEEYWNLKQDGTCTYFEETSENHGLESLFFEWTGTFSMKKMDEETVQATCRFTKRLFTEYDGTGVDGFFEKWEDMDMTSTHMIKLSDLKQA